MFVNLKALFCLVLTFQLFTLSFYAHALENISEQNCAIFKDDLIVEAGVCIRNQTIDETDAEYGAPGQVTTLYNWQSGRVIKTSNVEEFFTIDGSDGEVVFAKDGYILCVKNLKSFEIFCVGDRPTKKANISSDTGFNPIYPDWVIEAVCLNRVDLEECKNNLLTSNKDEEDTLQRPVMTHCEYSHPTKNWDFSEECFYTSRVNAFASIIAYRVKNGSNILIETVAVDNQNKRGGDVFFNEQKARIIKNNNKDCIQIISSGETFCTLIN